MIISSRSKRKSNSCGHPSIIGCSSINEIEIGLCLDCKKLISLKFGMILGIGKNKEIIYRWFSEHPNEIVNFNLWETI